jgi:hypothetical protein
MRCCKPDYPRTYANHSHYLMPRATSESSLQMAWTGEEPYPEIHRYHSSRGFNDTACFLYCVCPTPLPLTPSRLPCQFYPHVFGLQVYDGQPGWLTCPFLLCPHGFSVWVPPIAVLVPHFLLLSPRCFVSLVLQTWSAMAKSRFLVCRPCPHPTFCSCCSCRTCRQR